MSSTLKIWEMCIRDRDAGIAALVKKLKGNELILIPILMFIFSIGGTTYGMCEETVPFYLLLAATMVAAGFDSVVGAAVVLLGAGCGVLGSTVNPFAVGAAVDSLSSSGIVINQGTICLLYTSSHGRFEPIDAGIRAHVVVLLLDEQPVHVALALLRLHMHEHPGSFQAMPVQLSLIHI